MLSCIKPWLAAVLLEQEQQTLKLELQAKKQAILAEEEKLKLKLEIGKRYLQHSIMNTFILCLTLHQPQLCQLQLLLQAESNL